ncbi:MAG: galactokinase [Anaerolineales bacterium]
MTELRERITETFHAVYGAPPTHLVRAPGRVNLIGEHTDYNEGFVLPMAIDRSIWIALRPRNDREVKLYSLDFANEFSFNLDQITYNKEGWGKYIKGIAWVLHNNGYQINGWEGVIAGDIPIGAGLSSSAALELVAAGAFAAASGFAWEPTRMAQLAQVSENSWIRVRSGIMDQLVCAHGKQGHALLIDCRNLEMTPYSIPADVSVMILDTSTRRELTDTAYNDRRRECAVAAAKLGARVLRDAKLQDLANSQLDPVLLKRARHVLTENARVLDAVAALKQGNLAEFGTLLNASHASLRDDFEVSRPELDQMAAIAQSHADCYGARLTGAGFGGCVVGLVRRGAETEFSQRVAVEYMAATGLKAEIYAVNAMDGVEIIEF